MGSSPTGVIIGDIMASKKRKKKIANEGGYNWERNNVHIQRKKTKVQLKKAELRPQKKG